MARPPDFYIVGAPRCATTFMHRTLAGYPGVFMPERQHPHHCVDLDPGPYPGDDEWVRPRDAYLAQFDAALPTDLVGEACPWYLYSTAAAPRIFELRPDAKVIIGLRNPVDQLIARHALRTREGTEDRSLADALSVEGERLQGRRLPVRARQPTGYMYAYRAGARFREQVGRYLDCFPRVQVHVFLLEDLRRDPAATLQGVMTFLGLTGSYEPSLAAIDTTGSYGPLAGALLSRRARLVGARIPNAMRGPARATVTRVLAASWSPTRRASIPIGLRDELDAEFAPEVAALSELLGRDLREAWARERV